MSQHKAQYNFVAPFLNKPCNEAKGRAVPKDAGGWVPHDQLLFDAFGIQKEGDEEATLRKKAEQLSHQTPSALNADFIRRAFAQYKADYETHKDDVTWVPRPTRSFEKWDNHADRLKFLSLQYAVDRYDYINSEKKAINATIAKDSVYQVDPVVVALAESATKCGLHEIVAFGIKKSLADRDGLLRKIVEDKGEGDVAGTKTELRYAPHPPYIRIALTGEGIYDQKGRILPGARKTLVKQIGTIMGNVSAAETIFKTVATTQTYAKTSIRGSSSILELWPSNHYSPIHTHGDTAGIVLAVYGQLHAMLYNELKWSSGNDSNAAGLVSINASNFSGKESDCAWLNDKHYQCHKVLSAYSPLPGDFGASFHAYINNVERNAEEGNKNGYANFINMLYLPDDERHDIVQLLPVESLGRTFAVKGLMLAAAPPVAAANKSVNREGFNYIEEYQKDRSTDDSQLEFPTNSDLQWNCLLDEVIIQIGKNLFEFKEVLNGLNTDTHVAPHNVLQLFRGFSSI